MTVTMRVIIAGGSKFAMNQANYHLVSAAVAASGLHIKEVVSGQAPGIDRLGELWAEIHEVPVKPFPAVWYFPDGKFNRSAGVFRNARMAQYADALIAVWDGESHGTQDMIEQARIRGLPTYIHRAQP